MQMLNLPKCNTDLWVSVSKNNGFYYHITLGPYKTDNDSSRRGAKDHRSQKRQDKNNNNNNNDNFMSVEKGDLDGKSNIFAENGLQEKQI